VEPSIWLYATLGMWAWVPQDSRNDVLKQPMNRQLNDKDDSFNDSIKKTSQQLNEKPK